MKMITKISIGIALIGMISCGTTETEKEVKTETTTVAPETDAKKLYLFEGKKWIANNTTVDGMHDMIALHGQYIITDSPEDADVLVSELNAVLDGIFNACDMEGEAHNQLHIFLTPLIKSINQLDEAETVEIAKEKYDEVLNNLLEFDKFFEKA